MKGSGSTEVMFAKVQEPELHSRGVLGAEGRAPRGARNPGGLVGGRIGILVRSGGFTGALRVGSYLR